MSSTSTPVPSLPSLASLCAAASFTPSETAFPREESDPRAVYGAIRDELLLDGRTRLNLATFGTTWMEDEARRLMFETADKNLVDTEEYPQVADMEARCVRMLADLWHAPDPARATGCSTTGSSESAMLAGLALKRRWEHRRRAAGKDTARPNLVAGANVQVCWKKFCSYFDVEPRLVPLAPGRLHLTPDLLAQYCDERTVGVVGILGSTFDGSYEPIADLCMALDGIEQATGHDIPVHVDGASGAMVAPFLDPDLLWDFQLSRVASINTSGHKYGQVFPGLGWALWRDAEALPADLVHHVDYLGGEMNTFSLTFTRPASHVAAQYYTFTRYGHEGMRRLHLESRRTARAVAAGVAEIDLFDLFTDGSQLPAFAFRLSDRAHALGIHERDVAQAMRARGWQVPAYPLPTGLTETWALRVVVRTGFTPRLASLFLDDLRQTARTLRSHALVSTG
ncbi:glutamate decarboxylase [Streptomyces spiroverticillatus]|uniref:Glutamate decarboxylase n=1 Tax=Streptomyces finlayi TaxID=67296 RepID=A0A918WVZ1_9ACTN|nr:glutamate decarboxylase [Streptomyces finlayi]GHA05908.1 glutamate decarboxylase [Streptomyces spiroverticillatus]GHC89624.1 glutamate decarboxylase [Streptomyces finlayi]